MKAQIEESSLAEVAPGVIVDAPPISRFEEYWGFPVLPEIEPWAISSDLAERDFLERFRQIPQVSKGQKRQRLPELGPLSRYSNRKPYPVIDWVGDTFSRSSTATAEKLLVGDRKELRQGRRGACQSSRPPSPVVHVRRYEKPSWLTSSGVNRKRKMIERKGLPNMKNWRFITLTIDRDAYPDPLVAYIRGTDRLRRFMEAGRKKKLWKSDTKWAWKFEFQQDGYPHWHFFIGSRYKYTKKQLRQIHEIWGMGRTEVQRIEDSKFGYGFKYAFKPAQMESDIFDSDDFERLAPDWFLDYVGKKTIKVKTEDGGSFEAEKPVTFKRVRFWQTSKGFYTERAKPARPAKPQETWGVAITVREVLGIEGRTVQVIARNYLGKYESAATVTLTMSLEKFWGLVGFDTMHGAAVGLAVFSFIVPTHRIQTDKKTSWQLHQLLQNNQLRLRQAVRLQEQGETLRTC